MSTTKRKMAPASVKKRTLLLVLGRNQNLHHRFYDRDLKVLVRQRNATGVNHAADHDRGHEAEVDRDRPQLITDATVATAITLIEVEGEEIVIKIAVPIGEWIDRTEAQLLLVFCKYFCNRYIE